MKKIIIATILFVSFFATAQDKVSTTVEEYNYLTQGYAEQMTKGLDIKSGYELIKIDEIGTSDFIFTYSLFNSKIEEKTKAILIECKKIKDNKNKIIYLCLPFNNNELFKKYNREVLSLGMSMEVLFNESTQFMMSKLFDKVSNRCNK